MQVHEIFFFYHDGTVPERKFTFPFPMTLTEAVRYALAATGYGTDARFFAHDGYAEIERGHAWQALPEEERNLYLYAWQNNRWRKALETPVDADGTLEVLVSLAVNPGEAWRVSLDATGAGTVARGKLR
jgi:hypothetical protein